MNLAKKRSFATNFVIYNLDLVQQRRYDSIRQRIFVPSVTLQDNLDLSGWKRIYVFSDVETDAATEKKIDLRLEDYLKQHQNTTYYLSKDETSAYVVDCLTSNVLAEYTLEDSWSTYSDV